MSRANNVCECARAYSFFLNGHDIICACDIYVGIMNEKY